MPAKSKRLIIAAVLIGAFIGLVVSLLGGEFQRRLVFDSWQDLAPRDSRSDDVVVVMIDDASVAKKGQWPWRRTDVAALIENIAQTGPKVIGIDIYFTEPDRMRPANFADLYTEDALDAATREKLLTLPYGDQYLASVIENAPTVMPWAANASCFMSDMDTNRSIWVIPSQWNTSGIRDWNRMS